MSKREFTHTSIEGFDHNDRSGFILTWTCSGVGFGEITFRSDGSIDTECMDKEFVLQAFEHYLNKLEI